MTAIRKRKTRSDEDIAYAAAEIIAALPEDTLTEEVAHKIAAAFEGNGWAFRYYDDRLWSRPKFYLARQLRNSPRLANILFDSFK